MVRNYSDFFISGVTLLPVKIILHQVPPVMLFNCIIISISVLGFCLIIFFYFQNATPTPQRARTPTPSAVY